MIQAHAGWVWKLVRVSDDLFASASEDGTVKLWHAHTHAQIGCMSGNAPLRSMAVSPDGKTLVTGDVTGGCASGSICKKTRVLNQSLPPTVGRSEPWCFSVKTR